MKIWTLVMAAALLMTVAGVQTTAARGKAPVKKEMKKYKRWTHFAQQAADEYFTTGEAKRVGDNLLLYQHNTGGWPKNVNMADPLDKKARKRVEAEKANSDESTIDNGATTTEMIFLARLYTATGMEKYRAAVERGLDYLFESQYANGGWPQFYPRKYGYYLHITYNDGAMINVMNLLSSVRDGKKPFAFCSDAVREKARKAIDKGIDCILKTQVRQNGQLTVWCAQHDENTLLPAKARAYELISLSGGETVGITLFLMSIKNPSPAVIESVEAAVAWFKRSAVKGLKKEYFTNSEGKRDYRMVECAKDDASCPALWARFYTIEDNRPFFCDRDGIKRFNLSEIGHERRNGYSWYNTDGQKVLDRYAVWKKKLNKEQSL